jgi:PKD repeat protein
VKLPPEGRPKHARFTNSATKPRRARQQTKPTISMKKYSASESGIFNPRVFLALLLCLVGISLSMISFGATPSNWARSLKSSLQTTATSSAATPATSPQAPTTPGMPRYYNYAPGPGIGEAAGEPSIGFNPASKRVMYIASLQTLQATLPENITPLGSVPQACDANWADVSFITTRVRSADAILFTDRDTGRTFVSQLNTVTQTNPVLIGLNSLMAFTDTDGDPNPSNPNNAAWTPAQVNPPDGSNDHETVGAGPYPAALSSLSNPLNKGHAVYYCGQLGTVNAGSTAFCSRSDDGGLNFGRSIPVYQDTVSGCSAAIHGHIKVAPDGTAYLPNGQCGGRQSVFVSTDAATTWTLHTIPGSLPMAPAIAPATFDISDPSVGIASDGTVYFAYTGLVTGGNSTDDHIFVAVSHDRGSTWSTPVDVGASQGIKNAVFAAAVAGDPQRAAVAFIGTTTGGDHQSASFNGTWYGFVAHTYDGGQTWITVNASGGPVQRNACIWNSGGSNTCRNLLDFNDATMDDKGFVLFAYADGCVNECEAGGPNSYSSKATIARQSGGNGLLAQFDPPEPALAQRACLAGCRDDKASYLTWIAPDSGGSDITGYKIYRSDATHAETLIGQQTNPADNTFNDRDIDPTITSYTYRITAINGLGEGPLSNSVSLSPGVCLTTGGSCVLPGLNTIVDPAGDETDAQPAHDITSVSMAEPITNAVSGAASNVVVTIKVATFKDAAGNFTVPPGWRWSLRFGVIKNGTLVMAPSSGIPGDTSVTDFFVSMVSDNGASAGTPGPYSFTWGVTSTPNNAARLFTTKGTIDPSSSVTEDGTITLVVPKSIIHDPGPGDSIALTLASVRLGSPSGGTNDTIPDSTGAGTYILRADNLCLPNNPPLAVLNANVDHGNSPLQVNFDASASFDPDAIDHIASYTFNFNDGGDDVTQSTPTISHTFTDSGEYIVRLVVTDSRGKVSSNTATFLVEVERPLGLLSVGSRKIHGAAGPFDVDLPLTGAAGIECRTPGPSNSYQLIYTFNKAVAVAGTATKVQGAGVVGQAAVGPNPNQVTVPLSSVTNAQHFVAKLDGVQDDVGAIQNNLSARMDVLVGDVDATGRVDGNDVSAVQSHTRQTANGSNFRDDVDATGRIDGNDVSTTQALTRTGLP